MNLSTCVAAILLAAGAAAIWLASLGLLRAATPLDRLHCVGLGAVVGSASIAGARRGDGNMTAVQ